MAVDLASLPNQTLLSLMAGKTDSSRINALEILMAYANGLLSGSERHIKASNAKFAAHVGTGPNVNLIMFMLGFHYSQADDTFIPVPEDAAVRERKLRLALEEMSFRNVELRKKNKVNLKPDTMEFVEAPQHIAFMFGYDKLDFAASSFQGVAQELENTLKLGCMHNTPEKLVAECFHTQVKEDFANRAEYLNALAAVADKKNSSVLQELWAIEMSKQPYQLVDPSLEKAYRVFKLSKDDVVSDDVLILMYQTTYAENPMDVDLYREAFRTIAEARNSGALKQFLDEGVMPTNTDLMDVIMVEDGEKLPCGLNNVGNTCYLNSLLQLYYSIPLLRNRICEVAPLLEGDEIDVTKDGTIVTHAKFMQLFSGLLSTMKERATAAVTPPVELVEMVLKSSTEELQFGVQQDVNECMDHILSLLESAFFMRAVEEEKILIKRLFYGTTRQVLSSSDSQDKASSHAVKEEEFSSLIVDIYPDLYAALDSAFQGSLVEYDGRQALRTLSISNAPPILSVTLKRVQYSVEMHSTFKSNMFMKIHERIFLDRYLVDNEAAIEEKRREEKALIKELGALQSHRDDISSTVLQDALNSLQENEDENPAFYESVFYLTEMVSEREEAVKQLDAQISAITDQLDRLYEPFQNKPYVLHAVLFHQGEAQYGHYWIYLRDYGEEGKGERWLKYNDSVVSVVENHQSEIFGDTSGSNTNPYCLVYVEDSSLRTLLKT
ncbi:hypothetical protein BC829DRAFT_440327 [Chytridium lagenaria]|nr:hypothetical protein BC829DRAFT_440327 [Chytridium lagenaria]